jgi:protein-L-isoaspartate(D-aspartate) O-methyltransferase
VPIGHGQTISQPYIVALMTELVRPQSSDRVLEVGTGSGYQTAVLARLVSHVYTIELEETLGRRAEEVLRELKYDNVTVRIGDGYAGWPEHGALRHHRRDGCARARSPTADRPAPPAAG